MALARTNRGTKTLTYASQSTNTLVSNSFTPAAGALLVVMFQEVTTDSTPSLTMSSTFTGQGSWTTYSAVADDGFGSKIVTRIAWSVCGASPGTGTVTATRRSGTFSMAMQAEYIEVTGQDTTTPVAQNVTNTNGAVTSIPLNFGSAPASTSYLFFASDMNGSTSVAAPSGATGLGQFAMGSFVGENAEKLGSGSQNNSFTGGSGGAVNSGVAIEVAAQLGTNASATGAAVTATANGAQAEVDPTAGNAAVTVAAGDATAKVSPSSDVAPVGVSAEDPSISTLSGTANAPAGNAAVGVAAGDVSALTAAPAGVATVGVAANDAAAAVLVQAPAGVAAVTVEALGGEPFTFEPPTIRVYQASDTELLDLTVSQRAEGFVFWLLDNANRKVGEVHPEIAARIENDTSSAIMRRLQLKITPDEYDDVNPLEHRVMPRMVLENGSQFPLGVFLFADASSPTWSFGSMLESTLMDQGLILGQQLRRPIGFDVGDRVTDCLRRVAEIGGITTAFIDQSPAVLGSPLSWIAGGNDTYMTILVQLSRLAGFYAPYFDNEGFLRCRVAVDPASTTPALRYTYGGRIIAGTIISSNNLLSAPNVYVVYDNSATGAPILAEYQIPDTAPHSIARRGFPIPKVTEAPGIGSNEQALALAKQLAQTEPAAYETINFQGSTDPRHDTFDVLEFLGEQYIETKWAITCQAGGPHEHEINRVYL